MYKQFIFFALCYLFFTSCTPEYVKQARKDYPLFQKYLDSTREIQKEKDPTIGINDILSITVFSGTLSQEQANIFNIPNASGYVVDVNGNIELPIIGKTTALGLTKQQLQDTLSKKLEAYVKNPNVLVKAGGLKVSLIGEVVKVGTVSFRSDHATILDAIIESGGISPVAKRDNILVFREENGSRNTYTVDLRSGTLFQSPVYQLKQNDIIYVSPTKMRLRALQDNSDLTDGIRIFQLTSTVISLSLTLFYLIFKK